jgi:hypothetical protein
MAGARTEAGPTGAVRTAGEADIHTRAVRMVAAGRVTRAAEVAGTLARGGRAVVGTCLVEERGAVVDLAEDGRRAGHRSEGRAAGDREMEAEDMPAGTVALRARRVDTRRVTTAAGVTDGRVTDTAARMVAAVGRAIRTAATADRVDPVIATVETRAVTTALPVEVGMAATGTHTEIRAMGAAVMVRRRIAAIPPTAG